MATEGSRKAIIAALLANLGIAVAKFVGFLLTRASSMLAESVHSLADSGNQGLLLLGGSSAGRRPSVEHPFGYGRARYFWSFVVAVVLFTLGSMFSLYEGYHKLTDPEPIESVGIAVGILVVAIVLEGFSFRTAVLEANHVRQGEGWWDFIRHSKTPELPVVLLEDLGAQVGLVLALIGVLLAAATGDPVWDAYGTLAIGSLLGVIAIVLAIEMKSLLMGEAASPRDVQAIQEAIEGQEGVRRVIHLKTQHLGPEELLVAAKVELDGTFSFAQVVQTIDAAEARVRDTVPAARVMYIEPDVEPVAGVPGGS
ncbi:MAG: cation diffusion facilitator family transporter [Euzebyales bacterium]|nr:cation diffusion facilitator family transporter [Euzebyales bacterium]MBA3621673.1 cation diffusion facilitator family transporter [Euzebyales bacterium]